MTGQLNPILSADLLKESIGTMPSIFMMLPTKKYFDYDYYYEYLILQNGRKNLIQYKDFASTKDILSTMFINDLLNQSMEFQESFDPSPPNVEIWNIVGDGIGTIGRIGKKETIRNMGSNLVWEEIYTVKTITGDETVPLISANRGKGNNKSHTFYYSGAKHSDQMTDDNILDKIDHILSGTPYEGSSKLSENYKIGKRLVLTINSPVDLNIYDSEQQHSGPTGIILI